MQTNMARMATQLAAAAGPCNLAFELGRGDVDDIAVLTVDDIRGLLGGMGVKSLGPRRRIRHEYLLLSARIALE